MVRRGLCGVKLFLVDCCVTFGCFVKISVSDRAVTYVSQSLAVEDRANIRVLTVIDLLIAKFVKNVNFDYSVRINDIGILIGSRIIEKWFKSGFPYQGVYFNLGYFYVFLGLMFSMLVGIVKRFMVVVFGVKIEFSWS